MLNNNVYNLGYATGLTLHRFVLAVQGLWKEYDFDHPLTVPPVVAWEELSVEGLAGNAKRLAVMYKEWWMRLLEEDPTHVLVETLLIVFVVYLVVSRDGNKGYKAKKSEEALTQKEKDELLAEWVHNGRETLVPPRQHWDKSNIPNKFVVEEVQGAHLKLKGKQHKALNFATHDFLGMSSSDNGASSVKGQATAALNTYGCGSCGPRGFYGTIDAHLQLEQAMARFLKTDSAILYSDAASASTSAVAAFAKRGDLLIVDEAIYEPLRTGVTLSRATVKYFRHNDMDDLRRVLLHQQEMDKKLRRSSADRRKFIVVEGLYKHSGTIAPLHQISKLKQEFCYRLIVDESFSFGTIGPTGRGALEHFNLKPMYDAEVTIVGLEQSLGSIGGICVGTEEVVDHQRLSGAGYCFSASAPPFIAKAALASLQKLQQPALLQTLCDNRKYMYDMLQNNDKMKDIIPTKLIVTSEEISSIVILQLSPKVLHGDNNTKKTNSTNSQNSNDSNNTNSAKSTPKTSSSSSSPQKKSSTHKTTLSREEQTKILDTIASKCLQKNLVIVSTGRTSVALEESNSHFVTPNPSLKLVLSAVQTKQHVETCLNVLREVVLEVL